MNNIQIKFDFSHYLDLANQMISGLDCLCVFDPTGDVRWASNKDNNVSNVYLYKSDAKQITCMNYVFSSAEEIIAGVAVIVDMHVINDDLQKNLQILSAVIEREIQFSLELDAMSLELLERYEELNLVYESDDQDVEIDSGPEMFEQLVKNCTEYLNVAMSALIMPNEDLTIFNTNKSEKIHYIHAILAQLKSTTFPYIKEHRQSVVCNGLEDSLRKEIFFDIPYKVICSPVYVGNDVLAGILVTLNTNNSQDFTNSDRNLLETMAKKATKVAMANYDTLTGLYKRETYERYLDKALSVSKAEAKSHCLLHIDIDGIKIINETIDPKAGDLLIHEIAKLIRINTRDSDTVARLMGDKFGVLLDSCTLETGCTIADNIRQAIQEIRVAWNRQKIEATACIGVSELNADSENIQGAIAASELAASFAKENGQNIVQVYRQGDTVMQRRHDEVHWVRVIQKALKNDKFELHCQPINPISDDDVTHYEILIRMLDDDGNMVSPDNFIPAAERFRLMSAIDEWVIKNTFEMLSEFRTIAQNYMWTINLSGISLNNEKFSSKIIQLSERFDISPKLICFEITETVAVDSFDDAKRFINFLKYKGFSFALDDFGTGSSTFTYLKKLPVEYLKIDGSFIKEILDDPFSEAIVKSITQVSQVRGLRTIAEYVENEQILERVKAIGIDFAQGYGVGKPVSFRQTLIDLSNDNQHNKNISIS
ncbi:MAG: putative bifunctional diguanylate cyclase/phosphodiesterase [Gammaproteobacteria bacterium]